MVVGQLQAAAAQYTLPYKRIVDEPRLFLAE